MRLALAALALTLGSTGCSFYLGGGDGDDIIYCDDAAGDRAEPAPYLAVNPDTLECQDLGGWGGGGGSGCDDSGGAFEDPAPLPSWGLCDSECGALGEEQCLDTGGCRAAYDYNCYTGEGPCNALIAFMGCYPTDMSSPVQGDCTGFDAWSCSTHDDCIALHDTGLADSWSTFVECRPETARCGLNATEDACLAAADTGCIPSYTGSDCDCDPAGNNCTCTTWTFNECVEQR